MAYLLDTCVVSELRKPKPNMQVVARLRAHTPNTHHISVITIGEVVKGIALLPESARKTDLIAWQQQLEQRYTGKMIPVDRHIAACWGELCSISQRRGCVLPLADGLIAATAQVHRLTLVTRNTRDFEGLGLSLLNPWEAA